MNLENNRLFPNVRMKRTSGADVPVGRPWMITENEPREDRASGEHNVLDAKLDYPQRTISGLLFKEFKETPEEERPAELDDTLRQWARIRAVKRDLINANQEGFNIPTTIRGICTLEGAAGLLVTDLSEGGKNDVFDVKLAHIYAKKLSWREWQRIKAAVVRDINIATEHGIKIAGGNRGLDAWLIVKNKKKCEVYLGDISKYTSTTLDPFLRGGDEYNDLIFLRSRVLNGLEGVQKALMEEWDELAWWKLPWLRR